MYRLVKNMQNSSYSCGLNKCLNQSFVRSVVHLLTLITSGAMNLPTLAATVEPSVA